MRAEAGKKSAGESRVLRIHRKSTGRTSEQNHGIVLGLRRGSKEDESQIPVERWSGREDVLEDDLVKERRLGEEEVGKDHVREKLGWSTKSVRSADPPRKLAPP